MDDLLTEDDAFDFEDDNLLLHWEGLFEKDKCNDFNDPANEEDDPYGSSRIPGGPAGRCESGTFEFGLLQAKEVASRA